MSIFKKCQKSIQKDYQMVKIYDYWNYLLPGLYWIINIFQINLFFFSKISIFLGVPEMPNIINLDTLVNNYNLNYRRIQTLTKKRAKECRIFNHSIYIMSWNPNSTLNRIKTRLNHSGSIVIIMKKVYTSFFLTILPSFLLLFIIFLGIRWLCKPILTTTFPFLVWQVAEQSGLKHFQYVKLFSFETVL